MADYHSLLMRAVANLPNAGTPATRGAIYGRAKKALLDQLRSLRPPLPESDIAREEKALDEAIAEIEGRYGSERRAEPSASPTAAAPIPTSPAAAKPGPAPAQSPGPPPPAPTQPPPPAPQPVRRPRHPRPNATACPGEVAKPIRAGAERGCSAAGPRSDLSRPRPGRTRQPPASPASQAPTAPAGKPAAVASTAAASARRSIASWRPRWAIRLPAGPLPRSEREAARTRVCRG